MDQHLLSRILKLAEGYSGFSIPILFDNVRGKPKVVGTCMLIRFYDGFKLVSASHVLTNIVKGDEYYIPLEGQKKIKIAGRYRVSNETLIDIDIGSFDLTLPQNFLAADFSPHRVVDFDRLVLEKKDYQNPFFFIIGYPENKLRTDFPKNILITQAISLFGISKEFLVEEYKIKISFDFKNLFKNGKKISNLQDLSGMSGSPVWFVAETSREARICGILTENLRSDGLLVVDRPGKLFS